MRHVPSATVLSMVVYGVSGLAFVGANLLLARALSTEQFALITLLVALNTLGYHLAPLGLDGIVTRGRVAVGAALLKRAAVVTTCMAIAIGIVAYLSYGLAAAMAILVLAGTVAGGLLLVAAARFQSEQRFVASLVLLNSPNLVLLLGAAATVATGAQTARLSFEILTAGLCVAALCGWWLAMRNGGASTATTTRVPWHEAFMLAGVSAAGMLFIQLERLVVPYVLTVADLALFGVLGAIAGSLFRLLQMAVGFTLLPRLRRAASVFERRQLIGRELRFAVIIAAGGAAAILVLAPLLERWFLEGKYHLSTSLLVAALFSGVAKIAHAFARATSTALATPRELAFVNGAGWLSAVLAIGAAVVAAPWGLTGVIYGVGVGWLAWAVASFAVVSHHLRLPARVPAET
jgi:O-antigen/teichoic acid export membrane protein